MTAVDVFDVKGRVVLVTGGCGLLGRHFARALLARGAKVAVLDAARVNLATEDSAFADCAKDGRFIQCDTDVVSRASLESAVAAVERQLGVPYGLVNSAAIDTPPNAPASQNGPFEEFPLEVWNRVMAVNVTGTMLACQVVGARMRTAGRGSIINISSTYGMVSPDQRIYEHRRTQSDEFYKPISYAASKSAIFNMTRYLATYWGATGIRVNTLSFGGVFNHQDPVFMRAYESRTPLGRMARAEEYEGAIVFLMSDASSYMTGSNMVVDGGWTAW